MKAVLCRRYGSPDVLEWAEVEKPAPGDDEVLIRVRAASVNPLDWHLIRGEPYIARAVFGLGRPKDPRVGRDLAGEVEAVGKNVTRFRPGDAVFGAALGAFAEYACGREDRLARKPAGVTFEQAAAVPVAGISALQGLRDEGRIQPEQKVLINGAAGGVGTFAVQIGHSFAAEVTGVCSTRNVEMVRSIGADHVVDYTREDFTSGQQRYDVILDCVGNRSLSSIRRVLTRNGRYVGVGGAEGRWVGPLADWLGRLLLSPFASQHLGGFIASIREPDLMALKDLLEAGKLTPVIDRSYPLREVPEAIRYLEQKHARGKVIITVDSRAQ